MNSKCPDILKNCFPKKTKNSMIIFLKGNIARKGFFKDPQLLS